MADASEQHETQEIAHDAVQREFNPEYINEKVGVVVKGYVQLRDKLRELDTAHDEKRKPIVDMMNQLSGTLQEFLDKSGSKSVKTEFGTFYASTRYTTSLADPDTFMKYVISNQRFDLLDRRANATAVKQFVEETGNLPPGTNLNALRTVGVRRPGDKGE